MLSANSKNGIVELKGTPTDHLTELTLLVKSINRRLTEYMSVEESKELIMKTVDLAYKTPEQVHEELKNVLHEMIDKM